MLCADSNLSRADSAVLAPLPDILRDSQALLKPAERLVQQVRDLRNLGGPAHDIDSLMFEELIAQALRHAADDSDNHLGPMLFQMLEMAQV